MKRKLPPEAYSYYLSLGLSRSYQAVAKHYGVAKRSVTSLAVRERWQEKVTAAEAAVRQRAEEKAQETIEEMNDRHLKTLHLIQRKALATLRDGVIVDSMEAVRAIVMAVRDERLIRGEPTDRSAVNVEEIIKREYASLMIEEPEEVPTGREQGNEEAA